MKFDIHDGEKLEQARFKLGVSGSPRLFVFGVNPSTANKDKSDTTITKVVEFSNSSGFQGFIMLNLYPQRTTDPKELHLELSHQLEKQNREVVCSLIQKQSHAKIWAAWGNSILARDYLWNCLENFAGEFHNVNLTWLHCGKPTKLGHPRHPSRLGYKEKFFKFDIFEYLRDRRITKA